MQLAVLGIGTAEPAHRIEQTAAADFAATLVHAANGQQRAIDVLYRRSGVQTRGSVLLHHAPDVVTRQDFFAQQVDGADQGPSTAVRMQEYCREAPGLTIAAARQALDESGVPPAAITHLVTASCTGFGSPGVDVTLIKALPLSSDIARTHIGFMGCHAALNALRVAAALVHADPRSRVLVCATELCSLHFQYGARPEAIVSNALFSDGAAAVVCGPGTAADKEWSLVQTGSHLFADSEELMTWNIGDHGYVMQLSSRVPEVIAENLRGWVEKWLAQVGRTLTEVGSWAIHPGGPRILSAVSAALDLPLDADATSRQVLARCGNMSSPTILFILEQLRRQNAPRPCVALAFGPGLVVEAALFT